MEATPTDEERLAAVETSQRVAAVGAAMQGCGCLMTLFVTIPILLLLLLLLLA